MTNVNDRSAEIGAQADEWPMLEALMVGTKAMRQAGKAFLPQWPNEPDASYTARLRTATLFPAYRRTVEVMCGKPFAKALTLSDDTPAEIRGTFDAKGKKTSEGWADDIDREGVSLHVFAAEMFKESFFGLAGILVEAPKPVATVGPVPTRKDQAEAGVRPYFVRVMHNQILGWIEEVSNGRRRLLQLRIMECVSERDGAFGTKKVEQVRVLEPGLWQTYREDAKTKLWNLHEEGTTSLKDVPFTPIYGARKGFMQGAPPLIDLAYMNVEHWQSKSDQQTILHVARVPILHAKGFGSTEEIVIGAMTAVKSENPQSELKWVEHTGTAIEAGAKSLTALEEQMIQAGAELLVKKPGSRTATESANDAEANKSDLQRMVENFEDALDAALDFLAQYASLASGGHAVIYKDFGSSSLTEASGEMIISMEAAGIISRKTAINELKRRGLLVPEVNPEDEEAEIERQGPDLVDIPPAAPSAPVKLPAATA